MMRRTLKIVALALAAGLIGCRQGAQDKASAPLETEEIGHPIDAAVTTEYDVQAKSSAEVVGAQLPCDFPRDVPLYSSSSVINYGPTDSTRRFVELSVSAPPARVEPRYDAQIEAAGWRRQGNGGFVRGGRTIVVTYREGTPGTWVRIEYPTDPTRE